MSFSYTTWENIGRITKECYKCGEPFKLNDLIHRIRTHRGKRKIYHKKCWELMIN